MLPFASLRIVDTKRLFAGYDTWLVEQPKQRSCIVPGKKFWNPQNIGRVCLLTVSRNVCNYPFVIAKLSQKEMHVAWV